MKKQGTQTRSQQARRERRAIKKKNGRPQRLASARNGRLRRSGHIPASDAQRRRETLSPFDPEAFNNLYAAAAISTAMRLGARH